MWYSHPYRRRVPRRWMPQIDEQDYQDFLKFVEDHHVMITWDTVCPKALTPHQKISPIVMERVTPQIENKPIFVSADGYILDGHHRWMIHILHKTPVRVIRIELVFEQAIGLMFEFPKTYTLAKAPERN